MRNFFLSKMSRSSLGAHPASVFIRYWGFYPRGEVTRTLSQLPPYSAAVKNVWIYTSAPCACSHGIHRDKVRSINLVKPIGVLAKC